MNKHHVFSLSILIALAAPATAAELDLEKGDHICLVGNALGERMQHHNFWETLLHQRYPRHELVVRNLCFPGDEPLQRLRSLNFGSPDDHLKHSKAGVVVFFFGYNESFQEKSGLTGFAADVKKLVDETKKKNYSGKGPPRMVLVSPIAFEDAGDPNLPDGRRHNVRLLEYTAALKTVAAETAVGFVELYSPTKALFEKSEQRLTLNGAHLNEAGYRALGPIFDRGLFGEGGSGEINEKLRAEIADKNFHWWHRYRAVNGYSIYGKRGKAGSDGTFNNTDVMERERAILDAMCANRDARIWRLAQGKDVPAKVDDGNTPPFINPKTNVGGPNDKQRKAGKLGSLEYLSAAEQVKRFTLAPGYEINLVASEEQFPELANPVAINFDSQGRLWVATMPSYPQWKPKTKLDDKLLILEDHDQDGRADKCKVFARGLHQPTGFELGHGGVFVAQQPDVLFLKDTDGDDREDVRIRRLVGFDSADSHHGLAAFEWGPGGGLYFHEGTFKQSQIETIDGPERLSDAGTWRYDPRSEKFEVHASLAFANPWGHVFDRWGQNFIADASPGLNYWAAPISGYVPFPDKHPGGCRDRNLDWGGSKSNRACATFIKKRIRPSSGCEIVSSGNFPPEAQGNFLLNNVIGDRAVLQHRVREQGAGFVGEEIEPLVSGTDGNFRPVDLQFAPDGSLYIVDWHNALIGHLQHNLREPNRDHSHGRIWRVTYKNRPLVKPAKIAGASIESLLDLLTKPEDRTRYRARRELASRETKKVVAAVEKWMRQWNAASSGHQHHLLEALWVYQTHNVVNEELLQRLLESPDHRARAAATRVLSYWRDRVAEPLKRLASRVNDDHPRVRLEAVRACSFIHSARSIETALDVLNHEMDGHLEYTLDETVRVLEELVTGASASDHAHHAHAGHEHGNMHQPKPLVFLDKSPKIVQFQVARLATSRLLLVERAVDKDKYKPVYAAILTRPGVSRQDRDEAVAALAKLGHSHPIDELFSAIGRLDSSKKNRLVIRQLSSLLVKRPAAELSARRNRFRESTKSPHPFVRAAAMAGLIAVGDADSAWTLAQGSAQGRQDFLAGLPLVPGKSERAALRGRVLSCLAKAQPAAVRRAATTALASVPGKPTENFRLVARLLALRQLRQAAVGTLSRIPKDHRPAKDAELAVKTLIGVAEKTPPARRTTPAFLDAMHLADELLAALPAADAKSYREQLRKVVVRVVRINTVHEEMRYDAPFFVVEAGRPAQLVLVNDDLMPHNLVIVRPGKLREVAQLAAGMTPAVDRQGRQYVPGSKDVLFATKAVQSHRQAVLTFTAPKQPGEYPYVCTFPNHWMRMYGVMLVVKDLDAWRAKPVEPADPLGITRKLVKSWTPDDFGGDLAVAVRGQNVELGQRVFKEATCVLCHKVRGQGGAVGPDLSDSFQRHKHDRRALLREILDPSHKVDPKYALYNVITEDGRVFSGVITSQDREKITIVTNADKPQPQDIPRDKIEEMVKSSTSMMPKGLMDRYTEEEILGLLKYIESVGKKTPHTSQPRSGDRM